MAAIRWPWRWRNAAIDMVLAPGFLEHVNKIANYLHQQLGALVAAHPALFEDVRGQGLMLGLKMKTPIGDFIAAARANGLIVLPAGDNVVRLLPPLTITEDEVREGIALLNKTASRHRSRRKPPPNERAPEDQAQAFPGPVATMTAPP